ncbi:MAG: Gfo/Idh/MocA family oxidoreductase [Pseudomonadota bacterium]
MTTELVIGVLGAGYFARFHHEAWSRMPGARLAAIADRDLDKAREAAPAGVHALPGLTELLAMGPDILDVAVPPPAHAEAIRAGLAAGVRAIICQKPFGASIAEAEDLAAEAAAAGIPLIIHENFRFQPWYRVLRREIAAGTIGTPMNLTFRLRTGDGQGPEAYLSRQPYFQTMPRLLIHETGVHWIDTFRYLLGADPSHVYADLRRLNPVIAGEDAGHLILTFEGGVRALFDGNRLLDHAAENTRTTLGEALIEGSGGTLTLDGAGVVRARAFGERESRVIFTPGPLPGFAGDCVHALQAHVVSALLTGTPLENRAAEYLTVRRIEAAAYRSSETGARIALD